MKKSQRILVAGLGKSGTTALYFRIRNSMRGERIASLKKVTVT
jgi:DNA-binding MurR/RpiR family transcriptional regulator